MPLVLYLFHFRLDRHQHQRCKLNETATARAKVKCTKQKQHQIGVAQRIQANKQAGRWKCMYIYFSNGIKFKSTHLSAIETSLQAKSATHIHTHTQWQIGFCDMLHSMKHKRECLVKTKERTKERTKGTTMIQWHRMSRKVRGSTLGHTIWKCQAKEMKS